MTTLVHHGIIYVPLGYAPAFAELTNLTEVCGGSAYGAGTMAGGDGSRQPSVCLKIVFFSVGIVIVIFIVVVIVLWLCCSLHNVTVSLLPLALLVVWFRSRSVLH